MFIRLRIKRRFTCITSSRNFRKNANNNWMRLHQFPEWHLIFPFHYFENAYDDYYFNSNKSFSSKIYAKYKFSVSDKWNQIKKMNQHLWMHTFLLWGTSILTLPCRINECSCQNRHNKCTIAHFLMLCSDNTINMMMLYRIHLFARPFPLSSLQQSHKHI